MTDEVDRQIASVGALAEPARWALYRFVASAAEPISREQAASALEMPLHSAKFHLDRLVDEGLLEVEYRRLTGRTGPGAGRPAKLYRRAAREVAISLPGRRYDLAGDLLAATVDRSMKAGTPVGDAVRQVAHAAGVRLAAGVPNEEGADDAVHLVVDVLAGLAYEPRVLEDRICLANCPFDRLAAEHTELVCGMNLALVEGVLEGLEVASMQPRLEPEPGLCCVKIAH
jgi:predicted ArsR family transcriptional regulator